MLNFRVIRCAWSTKSTGMKIVLATVILCLASLIIRIPVIQNRPLNGYEMGDDATSHVLATCSSWDSLDPALHGWLPSLTQDTGPSLHINNIGGSGVVTNQGVNIYTSYPSGAFLAAYGYFKAFGIPPSVRGLRAFTTMLHLASTALLVGLAVILARQIRPHRALEWASLAAMAAIWLFHPETLRSFTISYWGQQLNQVLLPLAALCTLFRNPWSQILGWLVLFGACMVEYSALCSAVAVGAFWIFAFFLTKKSKHLRISAVYFGITLAAIFTLIFWFSHKMPVSTYAEHLLDRATSNSTVGGARAMVAPIFWISAVGLPLTIALVLRPGAMKIAAWKSKLVSSIRRNPYPYASLSLLVGACLENIAMANHVQNYPYDTVKLAFATLLVIGILSSGIGKKDARRQLMIAACLIPLLTLGFLQENRKAILRKDSTRFFERIGNLVSSEADSGTMVFSSWLARTAEVFYARRNIQIHPIEGFLGIPESELETLRSICKTRGHKKGMFVMGDPNSIQSLVVVTHFNTDDSSTDRYLVHLATGMREKVDR